MINQNEKWEEKESIIQKKNNSKQREKDKCDIIGETKNNSKEKQENGIGERKKKKRIGGIYRIKNLVNGKMYIGSAIEFNSRMTQHLHGLKNNKHHSILLQRSWNKYGKENFEFRIMRIVEDKNMLIPIEQFYLGMYQPKYNICKTAGNTLGRKRPELGELNSILKSKPVLQYDLDGNFIKEWKTTIEASKELNISSGHISNVCIKRKKHKTIGGFIWQYKINDNIFLKIDISDYKKFDHRKPVLQYDLDSKFIKEWDSITSAANMLKINRTNIGNVCRKENRKSAGKYKWKFKYE